MKLTNHPKVLPHVLITCSEAYIWQHFVNFVWKEMKCFLLLGLEVIAGNHV
jgi:hypothetical protein